MGRRKPSQPATPDNTQEDNMSTTDENLGEITPTTDAEFDQDLDVEATEPDEDVEEVTATEGTGEEKAAKEPVKPKRGELPEGVVTPIGFAKILGERGLHTNKQGEVVTDVKPQMVYSYMRNSPEDDRLETHEVEDSNGVKRQVLNVEEAIAWWERKNERAATRKANAAEKATKAAAKAETSEQAAEETDPGAATGQGEPAEEAE